MQKVIDSLVDSPRYISAHMPCCPSALKQGCRLDGSDGVYAACKRSASHCARLIHRLQIKMLVEEGGADVLMRDRWGATALDEVTKLGASRCIAYLKPITEVALQREQRHQEEEDALDAAASSHE